MDALLLDLDGVLVDSESLVRRGWLALAKRYDVPLTDADITTRMLGRRTNDVLQEVFGLDPTTADRLCAEGVDDKTDEIRQGAELPPVPGAVAFVRAAKDAGLRIAVVTSASQSNAEVALEHIGLAGQIDALIAADATRLGKPYPDPYLEGCRQLTVQPREAVAFEDSVAGVAAAKAAGAWCVALSTSHPAARLGEADLVIANFLGHTPTSIAQAIRKSNKTRRKGASR